jgi:hypothetical protein
MSETEFSPDGPTNPLHQMPAIIKSPHPNQAPKFQENVMKPDKKLPATPDTNHPDPQSTT